MSNLARALLAELDDEALDELARLLAPRLVAAVPQARDEEPSLLSRCKAAERLGISRRTVYRALADGSLQGRRMGSAWRIEPSALSAWSMRPPVTAHPRRITHPIASNGTRAAADAILGRPCA